MPSIADERPTLLGSDLILRSAAGDWLVFSADRQSPSEHHRTGEMAQLGLLCFIYFVPEEYLCTSVIQQDKFRVVMKVVRTK